MNFRARAFQRNRGPQPSVSVTTVDGRTMTSGSSNDRIDIRAGAINRGGYAEATGLNNSTVATAAGNDSVRIHSYARGMSTNAWAMRNSSLDVGPGNDKIDLRAVTRAGAFDPAYGMDNSSIASGQGEDKLRINAIARGNTTGTIAAYGALNSLINTGADDDKVFIRASATNRRGYAEAVGLDNSVLKTETGDDVVRIHAQARGNSTNAWAMRNSTLDVGPGNDNVVLRAVTRAGAFDPAYGMDTSSMSTGQGEDKLHINAMARGNTTDTIAAFGALNSQINTGADDDKVFIRASATNRRGYAEATGLDNSVLETETGDDVVRIHAHAHGKTTNAWAMRNSTLDVGPGNDNVVLRAVTRAGAFDPAYGMDTSSLSTGQGEDKLRINATARGSTMDTIAAFGALNSQINTGANHDKVEIRASATNRRGYAEAIGLDNSVLETETGDDVVRIDVLANGKTTNAWAMRNSTLDVGPGDDKVEIKGNTLNSTVRTGEGFDSIRVTGLETKQLLVDSGAQDDVLTVDGGTGITYISGAGSDKLHLTRNYFTSLLEAKESQEQVNQVEKPMSEELKNSEAIGHLNIPVSEKGRHAGTNQFKPALGEDSTIGNQVSTLNSLNPSEAPHPEMNPKDALMFVDFITGENGDSINCDDILIGHGIGLNRQSVFEDGFLSFAQEGNDSLLYFDADGYNQQENDKVALVIFKDAQAADFSQHNLNSRIINKNDFLLSQEAQQNLNPNPNPTTETLAKSEGFNHAEINPSIAGLETDPILMSSNLQPANDQLNPFATNPAMPGSETNPMLNNTDLQPSIQLV